MGINAWFLCFYELFKIDFPPKSYEDFKGRSFLQEEDSFIDNSIRANKNYYYMFRGIDYHGNVSNPSPIYKFRIEDDGISMPIPVVEIYEFPKKAKLSNYRNLRKYLYISPSEAQMTISSNGRLGPEINMSDVPERFVYGNKSVWGRKVKIRLTSKQTGKKVDMIFNFKNKVLDISDIKEN